VHVSYFLTEPDADGAGLLGSQQWQWLHALPALDAQQHVAITVVVSSIQIVNNQSYGSENWGLYPAERARLLALLRSWPCSVIVVSGDRHYSELAQECRSLLAACSVCSEL
jgi:alkaline phosphatase D